MLPAFAVAPLAIEAGRMALMKNIALIVFFLIFVGVGVRLLLRGRDKYERASRLPLDDDAPVTPRRGAGIEAHAEEDRRR